MLIVYYIISGVKYQVNSKEISVRRTFLRVPRATDYERVGWGLPHHNVVDNI